MPSGSKSYVLQIYVEAYSGLDNTGYTNTLSVTSKKLTQMDVILISVCASLGFLMLVFMVCGMVLGIKAWRAGGNPEYSRISESMDRSNDASLNN